MINTKLANSNNMLRVYICGSKGVIKNAIKYDGNVFKNTKYKQSNTNKIVTIVEDI